MGTFSTYAFAQKHGTGSVRYTADDGAKVTVPGLPQLTARGVADAALSGVVKVKFPPVVIDGREVEPSGKIEGMRAQDMVYAHLTGTVPVERVDAAAGQTAAANAAAALAPVNRMNGAAVPA